MVARTYERDDQRSKGEHARLGLFALSGKESGDVFHPEELPEAFKTSVPRRTCLKHLCGAGKSVGQSASSILVRPASHVASTKKKKKALGAMTNENPTGRRPS